MSHEIETHTNEDGTVVAAAAFARVPAWHRLGTTFEEDLTAEDVLERAYLGGWNVRKDEAPAKDNEGLEIPGVYAIARTNPFDGKRNVLGSAGRIFTPFQNEDTLDTLNTLRGETNGRFETAGSLYEGRMVFVTAKLPDGMLIGGVDPVDRYLTSINRHDGSGAWLLLDTPIRVVCANTASAALKDHKSMVKIRHTINGKDSIEALRRGLDITFKFDKALEDEFERMIQTTITEAEFVKGTRKVWPLPADKEAKRANDSHKKRELELVSLFLDSPTNKDIRGTRWAAYNAVTEYFDWQAPVTGKGRDANVVRAERSINRDSYVPELKEAAFAAFRVPESRKATAKA